VFGVGADKEIIYAAAVGGIGLGKCRTNVSVSFLMKTFEHLCVLFLSFLSFRGRGIKTLFMKR
jgi:hypothetical protein